MIIETGTKGIPLREIIAKLGNKTYSYIECRCKWSEGEDQFDTFIGSCSYDNKTNILIPLDGDSYSLNDLYVEWKEFVDDEQICLTVWENGEIESNK